MADSPGSTTTSSPAGARRRSDGERTTALPGSAARQPEPPMRPSPGAGGLSRGDRLFLVFFAATMVMVVAVVLVGAVDRMWVLVPVMLVDLTVTFVVVATLVSVLGDDGVPS